MVYEGSLQRIIAAPLLGCLGLFLWKYLGRPANGRNHLPYPPGPKAFPILGNVFDFPIEYPWLALDQLSRKHGDIVHLQILGNHVVILSSMKAAVDLMEKRSTVYSGRPHSVMLTEIMGFSGAFGGLPYGEEWRRRRRAFHSQFQRNVVGEYQSMQLRETHLFIANVLKSPGDALGLSRLLLGAIIMKAVYGLESRGQDDKYLKIADDVVRRGAAANVPGAFLVELIPALKYIPAWFPGAGWKRFGLETAQLVYQMIEEPFQTVKQNMAAGTALPSVTSHLLGQGCDDTIARDVAGIAYGAGADTVHGAISIFLNAMLNNPIIQAKAQAELDKVIGRDRLPDFTDREQLPYINAIIMEVLRWQPVTPLGVPHASTEDDVYNGYFIPKGSTVIANLWSLGRDPEAYPDPDVFNPERFLKMTAGQQELDSAVQDPTRFCFGFGRRICPGMFLAEQIIYIAVVSLLATCNITPVCDVDSHPIDAKLEMASGLLSTPIPFKCRIEPRSVHAMELIQSAIDSGMAS